MRWSAPSTSRPTPPMAPAMPAARVRPVTRPVTDDARAVMRGEREPVLPTTLGEAIDRDFDDEHDASRFAAEVR